MKQLLMLLLVSILSIATSAQGNGQGKGKGNSKSENTANKNNGKDKDAKDRTDHEKKIWEGTYTNSADGPKPSKNQPAKVRAAFQRNYPQLRFDNQSP